MTYYVYRLVDPRTGEPFYIGKGKGNRIAAHERDAAQGVYSRKCAHIREIWAAGHSVRREIVSRHGSEVDAYAAEAQLIDGIGLEYLTNVLPGGGVVRVAPASQPFTVKSVRALRVNLLKALAWLRLGQRIYVHAYDVTPVVRGLLRRIVRDLGAKGVREALLS